MSDKDDGEKKRTWPPKPEEIQEEFTKFLSDKFGSGQVVKVMPMGAFGQPEVSKADDSKPSPPEEKNLDIEGFSYTPKDIKKYLDRFVIGQDDAKKVLAISVCDHYHHVNRCRKREDFTNYSKPNVILIGPTGVGKTYLVKCIAELVGVPFVKADATKFSETGYVGGDVEDIVRELVERADGDIERAQFGIVYVDEFDKIASASNLQGRDVSGRGVQSGLLKLMEDTDVSLRNPTDMIAQFKAMMEFQSKGKADKGTINTRNILFIVSGAFAGLADIVRKRLDDRKIGFKRMPDDDEREYLRLAQSADFIKYGFEPETVGRLPVRVALDPLTVDQLYEILKSSEGSVVRQYIEDFDAYGIDLVFADDGMKTVAERAHEEETGARGLVTVCEKTFREFKYELPESGVRRLAVDRDFVLDPSAALKSLLNDPSLADRYFLIEEVRKFEAAFQAENGIEIRFDDTGIDALKERCTDSDVSVKSLCDEIVESCGYGLKLLSKTRGRDRFTFGRALVVDPTSTVEEWIRDSYSR